MDADDRAAGIVEDCWARIERGEPVDPEAVISAHPDLAPALRRRFDVLRGLGRAYGRGEPSSDIPPTRSLAGTRLGPYRLVSAIGSGGMGTVYLASVEGRATGLAPGERVALKVVHPHLLAREGFFRRFLREAEIGRRLRHENVVRTLDADAVPAEGGHVHFLVLEYVEGQTLRGLLAELERVPEELCRHVGREVAKALAAIHAAGAVHRDLKPDNVLITSENVVKVMDLGVARLDDEALAVSQTGAFVGSVRYAAPEQFRGRGTTVDGRADLYALGLVLYELATGRHPFPGDDFHVVLRQQMTEVPRPAGELNPQLSAFFEEVLRTLLAKDRERRFGSADSLRSVLEEGEKSSWWLHRANEVRASTKRPLRRIRIPRETALYGRDTELARLRSYFERAKAGDGQVVLVLGEAGIGKSRLVDEFVGQLEREGEDLNFLHGSYPPGGAATVSGAFSTAFREHFGEGTLEDALREALPQTPILVPAFAALLRGDSVPPGAEPLTKDSLQTVFVHATRHLAAERPTILLIEDLHFAPEEGRALFAALSLAVSGHRILLVGATRPGLDEKWIAQLTRQAQTTQLALQRLGPKELVRLLRDALRSARLAEELSALIAVKSDGNPYFVFEILRGLREGQFLRQQPDGTWVTTQVLRDIQIPSTVKDLVAARIADLEPEDKDLLDVAACVGFEFDAGLVADALGVPHVPVLRRLARIEARHRLVRSVGERFVFDHHQVQETLYAALPPPLAREYHASIAGALEAASGAASKGPGAAEGATCVHLADHFLRGGAGQSALRYLDAALTYLDGRYLHGAALGLAERALAVPSLLEGRRRCEVVLYVTKRLELLGRGDAEVPVLEEAVALADAVGDAEIRTRARMEQGRHLWQIGRYADAEAVLAVALDLARRAGNRSQEARAMGIRGLVLHQLGRLEEALACHQRDLAVARESGDRQREAVVMGNLGFVLYSMGRHAEALAHDERHLALAREMGDRRGEGRAAGNLGVVFWEIGRLEESRRFHERHLEIARDVGDRFGEARTLGNLGLLSFSRGRYDEDREWQTRSLALAREIGSRLSVAFGEANLAVALEALGRSDEARAHFQDARSLGMEIGAPLATAWAVEALADLDCDAGRTAEAEAGFRSAMEMLEAAGAGRRAAGAQWSLGRLLAQMGRVDEARLLLESALAVAVDSDKPGMQVRALAELAVLDDGYIDRAEEAVARFGPRVGVPTRMDAHLALFRATDERTHLVEAKRLLDEVVAAAPPKDRESMLTNVRLHREIAAAAREHLAG